MKKQSPTKDHLPSSRKSIEEYYEMKAGLYVYKFNELCRQNNLKKPSYKWKNEKSGGKNRVKYYITQDELGISVKVTDKFKNLAKYQSTKLAYEDALNIISSKKHSKKEKAESHKLESDTITTVKTDRIAKPSPPLSRDDQLKTNVRFHDQLKNIATISKVNKKELMPGLARIEQDIDVFLDSESKMYQPEKHSTKTKSVESNPIEYSMMRKGQNYFDINIPVLRVPSPLPNIPLPFGKKNLPIDKIITEKPVYKSLPKSNDSTKDQIDKTQLDQGSTLRISSGVLKKPMKTTDVKSKSVLEEINKDQTDNFHILNNLQTVRSRAKRNLQIQPDLDVEMLQYLETKRKALADIVEQIRNDKNSADANYIRLLNFLLLQNEKVSIEIKINSDFGKLKRKQQEDKENASAAAKTIQIEKSKLDRHNSNSSLDDREESNGSGKGEKMATKSTDIKSNVEIGKLDLKNLKIDQKTKSPQSPTKIQENDSSSTVSSQGSQSIEPSPQKSKNETEITWISRIMCFYLDCCFSTIVGIGSTTNKAINDAAIKMILYFYSLIN